MPTLKYCIVCNCLFFYLIAGTYNYGVISLLAALHGKAEQLIYQRSVPSSTSSNVHHNYCLVFYILVVGIADRHR